MNKTKNDNAWEKIFEEYKILDFINKNQYYKIEAKDIKKHREPRLMTKFDNSESLPEIFRNNKLSILPVSRGSYIISDFKCYHKLQKVKLEPIYISSPNYIETLNKEELTSESLALNYALLTDIFNDFLGEEELYQTISGRMSSDRFSFSINGKNNKHNIYVEDSQIEIDSSLESPSNFYLIEAKNLIHEDFIIRQLYYPFRKWQQKINKPIYQIFSTFSNGEYTLYLYKFIDINHYNSLELIKSQSYIISSDSPITINDIKDYINVETRISNITFPQANSFKRIINLCEILYTREFLTGDEITDEYQFSDRQKDYYTNACLYLDIIQKVIINHKKVFILTDETRKIFKKSYTERTRYFIKKICKDKIFNQILQLYFKNNNLPHTSKIIDIILKYTDLNLTTAKRRRSTVTQWVNWIFEQCDEY